MPPPLTKKGAKAYHNVGEEAEVVEGGAHSPLPQGVKEDIVGGTTLVPMELVEQTVALVKLLWVLKGGDSTS